MGSSTGWKVEEAPAVTIGELEGAEEYLLNQVTGGLRMPDGRIVILNSASAEVRVYDRDGRFLKRVGRRGWGPGEFQRPEHVVRLAGDTIAVWDAGIGPLSYFDSDLRFVRRESIERMRLLNVLGASRATEALTPLNDGSFILHVTKRDAAQQFPEGQVFRPPLGFFRFASDLSRVDSLGWFGGLPQMYLNLGGRRVYAVQRVPTHAVAAAGGDPLVVYAGNGEPYEIRAFDASGQLRRLVRRVDPPIPLPSDTMLFRRSGNSSAPWMEEQNRVRAAMPRQTHYPAYFRIYSDRDGFLWVRSLGDGMHVFNPAGRWLGPVAVKGQPLEIGRDYVLVLARDSLQVESVQLFNLRRLQQN